MKVLVTHELFFPTYGGGEEVVYKICKNLQKRGVYLEVLTTGNPKIKKYDNIITHRLPINRYFMNFTAPIIHKFAKKFDLIQTNNYNACFPSYIAGKLSKKPVVCFVHGMYGDAWKDMRGKIFGNISKLVENIQINHDFDKMIFSGEYARKEALKYGVKKDITKIISPGIYYSGHKQPKISDKKPYVLFVGRLAKQKGLDYLIEAAEKLPEIEFKLVGTGEEYERLKNKAPKNVKFLGWKTKKELSKLYSEALVFCLPSVGEGFGLVLAEAMYFGCAIVSTIPLNFKGAKIRKRNVEDIKNSIKYLIKNEDEAKKFGKENMKRGKKYNWKDFTKELLKTYKEILE